MTQYQNRFSINPLRKLDLASTQADYFPLFSKASAPDELYTFF